MRTERSESVILDDGVVADRKQARVVWRLRMRRTMFDNEIGHPVPGMV